MRYTFFLLLLSFLIAGQSIDYTVTVLDRNTDPVYYRGLQQVLEAPNGVYLYHGFGLNTEESTVSYFDGDSVRQLYQSAQPIELLGATVRGAFVRQRIRDEPFDQHILFVARNGGAVDTLTSRTLQLPHTYQLGEQLLTFSNLGVIAYAEHGEEQILRNTYDDCNCGDYDRFFRFGDRLVYNNRTEYILTDGTLAGTRKVFNKTQSPKQLEVQNGKLYHPTHDKLEVFDPATGQVTNLAQELPGIGQFTEVHGIKATENGLLITATTEAEGRELFITDGTRAGTRALKPLRSGPEDGVVVSYTGDYYNSGSFLVFQYNDAETAQLWVSDGTDRGTFKIVDGATYDLSQGQDLRIRALQDGTLQVIVSRGGAGGAAVLNVNPRNKEQATVLVGTLPYSASQVPLYTLSNRLLVGGSYYSDTLLSFGTQAGEVEEILTFGFGLDTLGLVNDVLYLLLPDGNEGLGIYATRGRAGDLRLINKVVADDPYAARVFSIGQQAYAYAFDPELGDAIYRVENDLATTLVSDLYRNNAGDDIYELFAAGNSVVWSTNDGNGWKTYFSDGRLTVTDTIALAQDASPIGAIGPLSYFATTVAGAPTVTEINEVDGALRVLPGDLFASAISDFILVGSRIYYIREVGFSFSQQVQELVAVDPVAGTSTSLRRDVYPGDRNKGRQFLATDGEQLYLSAPQGGGFGPAIYTPATSTTTLLGEVDAVSPILYYNRGGRIRISYSKASFGDANRLLTATGFSTVIPDIFPTSPVAAGLSAAWVQLASDGRVYGVDYQTGAATLLEPAAEPDDFLNVQDIVQVGVSEALFIRRTGEMSSTLWRTNGTLSGTQSVLDLPGDYWTLIPFAGHLVIADGEGFYLIDLAAKSLTRVPLQLAGFGLPIVVGDRLYFSATDPVFGQELHYLTVGVNDGPSTALREVLGIQLQVYPNPTANWVTLAGPIGQPVQISLFDLAGRSLHRSSFTGRATIDLSGYPSGTYLLQMQDVNSGASGVRQLVKQ